ncbi:MAG TPA: hypothetical protein VJ750_09975 [Rhizomicrobium sp.]|nr:hypothetical protein [Rhizomicrobium sp.]
MSDFAGAWRSDLDSDSQASLCLTGVRLFMMVQPRIDQLEEHRNEEDRQHGSGNHAAHHAGSDGVSEAWRWKLEKSDYFWGGINMIGSGLPL